MILAVIGVFCEGGSLLQKVLFLVGGAILLFTALMNRQKMLITLQFVIVIGAILGFFSLIPTEWKYLIMLLPTIFGVGYLFKIGYFKKDPFGLIGSAGLFCIALGFAVSAVESPVLFNILLGGGGILVAVYSGIEFFHYKVRISLLWVILNVVFAINPLIFLISNYSK